MKVFASYLFIFHTFDILYNYYCNQFYLIWISINKHFQRVFVLFLLIFSSFCNAFSCCFYYFYFRYFRCFCCFYCFCYFRCRFHRFHHFLPFLLPFFSPLPLVISTILFFKVSINIAELRRRLFRLKEPLKLPREE